MSEAQVWDRLAGRYGTIVRLFDSSYERVRRRLDEDIPEGGRVLEVAAGTGQFTPALARRAGTLVATDISPAMVAALRTHSEGLASPDVSFAVASADALPANDATVDALFCANALHVMDAPERALAEFRRVLKPEGTLIVPTFLHGTSALRRGLSRTMSFVSPFVAHTRYDMDTFQAAVTAAGFDVQHAEEMPGLFPLAYVVATA